MALPAVPWLHRLCPALGRRLVVLDPGSRFVKALVVDARPGTLRVVHFQTFFGSAADPLQAETLAAQLDQFFADAGPHERVLVLPQYRCISALLDLPAEAETDRSTVLAREARRLSGLDENALVWNAVPLKPWGRLSAPCWLNLCKREELDGLLERFAPTPDAPGAEPPDLAEVIPSGQALFAAAARLLPASGNAILVDLRGGNSVVAIVAQGQGVGTATVPLGLSHLQAALGRPVGGVSLPADTTLSAARPGASALEDWATGIRLALTEWLEDNPDSGLGPADFRGFLCGLGATDPELLARLNRTTEWHFEPWEARHTSGHPWPMADYLVAYGAALQTLKRAPAGLSFLPAPARALHRRRRALATVLTVNVALLVLLAGALARGIQQKRAWIEHKRELTRRSEAALQTALDIDRTYRALNLDYERVFPVLLRQRQTWETLQALAAVRESRTNDAFWYVLFADAPSYQAGTSQLDLVPAPGPRPRPATNAPAGTNLPPAGPVREFITELCIPADGEALRRVLSDVAAQLRRHVLFRRVDALPDERKQQLVDPAVAVTNRVFALALEVAGRPLPPPRALTPPSRPAGTGRTPATPDAAAGHRP